MSVQYVLFISDKKRSVWDEESYFFDYRVLFFGE